jgi:hypothetical protein
MSAIDTATVINVPDTGTLRDAVATLSAWHASLSDVRAGRGLEPLIAGATLGVSRKTFLLPGPREIGCGLLRGVAPDRLRAARPWRVLPPGTDPAQRALQAVGIAMSGEPALVFLGMGSLAYGAAQEALSLAVLHRAPVCFVVGWYEGEGPFAPPLPVGPATLALALGIDAVEVDGTDAAAVCVAVAGSGPRLVEARLRGRE